MKAYLLYSTHDFAWGRDAQWNESTLVRDLELEVLYRTMAAGDEYLYDVVRKVLLTSLTTVDEVLYRQEVLKDCVEQEQIVRQLLKRSSSSAEAITLAFRRLQMRRCTGRCVSCRDSLVCLENCGASRTGKRAAFSRPALRGFFE